MDAYRCIPYPLFSRTCYRYTVVFVRYQGKWIFCRHRRRDTWETPGGHIEPGETPLDCAKRGLWEETGAVRFMIVPAFDYWVEGDEAGSGSMVFYAGVKLGRLPPEFEMKEIRLYDGLPEKLSYPFITPVLYEHLNRLFWVEPA